MPVATNIEDVLPAPNWPVELKEVKLKEPKLIFPAVSTSPPAAETVTLLPKEMVRAVLFIVNVLIANGVDVATSEPVIVPLPLIVSGLLPPVRVPLPKLISPFKVRPAPSDTKPFDKLKVPFIVRGVPVATVVADLFIVKLLSTPPLFAAKKPFPPIVPEPAIIKFDVDVPTILLALLVLVIIPFMVRVFPAPIPTKPNGAVPPKKVVVPDTVTDEDNVIEGDATEPLKVLEKFKLLIVAGNKAPVV